MNEALRALREPHGEARARRNWEQIHARRAPRTKTPWRGWVWALPALAIAAVVAWRAWTPETVPGSLLAEDGAPCLGPIDAARVALDDGSSITLDPATELEVLENDGSRMRLWMRSGAADFDVTPGGPRRWSIEAGVVSVEVIGTSFRVERREHSVDVSVTHGTVIVRGPTTPGGLVRLGAGASVSVPSEVSTETASIEAAADVHAISPDRAVDLPTPAAHTIDEASPVAATETRRRSTEPDGASTEADGAPAEAAVTSVEVADELTLARADELRRLGRIDEARDVLAAIADAGVGADAALAAFTLGRLELEQRHAPRAAAEAFQRALALGLPGTLVEDARARRVQALAELGDADATEAAARDYLSHHPDGRRRVEVERWAAED